VKSCSHLNKKIRSLDLCVMCFLPFCFDVAGSEVSFILRFRFGRCKLRACKQLAFSFEFSCRRRVCSSIFSCHSSCPLLCSFFPGRIHFARSPAPITASKQLLFPISFFLVVFSSLRWSRSVLPPVSWFSHAAALDLVVFFACEFKARRQDSVFSYSSMQRPS
jgi:hypothetical protein